MADDRAHDFVREQLDTGEPQVRQYDPEAGKQTLKKALEIAAGITTPGAIADFAGYLGGPSALENIRNKNYGTAALQAASIIPGVGPFSKAARIAEEARAVEKVAPTVAKVTEPIRAYHGSPHQFERFDLGKVGTGEGAQAYGHGLYFAKNENVARNYLGDPEARYRRFSGHMDPREEFAFDIATNSSDPRDMDIMMPLVKKYGNNIDFDEAQKLATNAIKNRGHMYEVDIHADPSHMIDWDRPLAEQPEYVRSRLNQLGIGDITKREVPRSLFAKEGAPPSFASFPTTGRLAYQEVAPTQREATEVLKKLGIPGVKYLDQLSRDVGKGTSNYSIFDPNVVEILRRYADGGKIERKTYEPIHGLKITPPSETLSEEPDIRDYQLKRHAHEFENAPEPVAPRRPVVLDAPLFGGKYELGSLPYSYAPVVEKALNLAYGQKTLPLYFNRLTAPAAMALDAYEASKFVGRDPSDVKNYTGVPGLLMAAGRRTLPFIGVGAGAGASDLVAKDHPEEEDRSEKADGGNVPLPPERPSREELFLAESTNKYPFIKQYQPHVKFNPRENVGYAETFGPEEEGAGEFMRPKEFPMGTTGIEVYRPDEFSAQDYAAEFLHVDPRSHKTREILQRTFTPRQLDIMRGEPDYTYSIETGLSPERAMQNVTDAVMRGYVMGQWPNKAIEEFKFTNEQRKALDDLKRYTTQETKAEGGPVMDYDSSDDQSNDELVKALLNEVDKHLPAISKEEGLDFTPEEVDVLREMQSHLHPSVDEGRREGGRVNDRIDNDRYYRLKMKYGGERGGYPVRDRDHWNISHDYESRGGVMKDMSPEEFLKRTRHLNIDAKTRRSIDNFKHQIANGVKFDPLQILANGSEDGRHRAMAAKELGIKTVPVIDFRHGKAEGGSMSRDNLISHALRIADTQLNPLDKIQDPEMRRKVEEAIKNHARDNLLRDDERLKPTPEQYRRGNLGYGKYALSNGGRAGYALGGEPTNLPTDNYAIDQIDPTQSYVQSLYQNVMGRAGDQAGIDYWTNQLNEGNVSQSDILHSFAQSPEFQSLYKADPSQAVGALYQTALGRSPDKLGLDYWTQQAQSGLDLGQMVSGFTGSEEGEAVDYINQLYQNYYGTNPTQSQLQQSMAQLSGDPDISSFINKTFPLGYDDPNLVQEAANKTKSASDASVSGDVTVADPFSQFGAKASRAIQDYLGRMGNFDPLNAAIRNINWDNAAILKKGLESIGIPLHGVYSALGNFNVESIGIRPDRIEGIRSKPYKNKALEAFRQRRLALSNQLKGDDWQNVDLNELAKGRLGIGVGQWTGDRAVDLIKEAKRQGVDWRDMNFQTQYLIKDTQEKHPEVIEYYKNNPPNPARDIAVWERIWENPATGAGRKSARERFNSAIAASQYFGDAPESWGKFSVSPLVTAAKQQGAPQGLPAGYDASQDPAMQKYLADKKAYDDKVAQYLYDQAMQGKPLVVPSDWQPPVGPIPQGNAGATLAQQGAGGNIAGGGMFNPGGGAIGAPADSTSGIGSTAGFPTWTPQSTGSLPAVNQVPVNYTQIGTFDPYTSQQTSMGFDPMTGIGLHSPLYAGPGQYINPGISPTATNFSGTLAFGPGFKHGGAVDDALRIARATGGGAWTRKEGKNPKGGLNEKGRASLRAQGHDIKRPQPEGGSRKDSFCARMKGMKAKLTSAETANDPNSRINKSLRVWNCHSAGGVVGDALRVAKGGNVWDKPRPKDLGKPEKLSSSQKKSAKASAKAAGRPYPNLVDNLRAARKGK